ncbi:MAG: hypothetical protein AB7F83_08985 [Lysobacterales bacterium]
MTRITLSLPDELAQQAESAGLLSSSAVATMLREQLRRQAGLGLRELMERMPREELTPEIEQEIVAEVRAYRAERRRKREAIE